MLDLTNRVKAHLWPATEFVAHHLLEDSLSRLRAKAGVYSGVNVQVRTIPVNRDTYQFRLTATRAGWDHLNMELHGQLQRHGEVGTRVLIHPAKANETRMLLAAFLLVCLLLLAAINGGFMAVMVFGCAASASWFVTSRREDELTRIVRDALDQR